jgi:hypothetical protein
MVVDIFRTLALTAINWLKFSNFYEVYVEVFLFSIAPIFPHM